LLASEIRKLPEFQDGITNDENKALGKLVTLYNKNQGAFDKAFQEMYQVGKPEVRKYCSPLQAIFWLAEDGRNMEINEILEPYSLDRLLDNAWAKNKSTETGPYIKVLQLTKEQVQSIIAKMSNEKQEFYEGMSPKMINDVLLIQYKDNPRYLPKEIRKTIKSSLKENPNKNYKNYLRLKDFYTVVDRLNSPHLIHYYINKNFGYRLGDFPPPYTTFKRKYGNCTALADFGFYLLRKAGYDSFVRSVYWGPRSCNDWHTVAGIKHDSKTYEIVVHFNGRNIHIQSHLTLDKLDHTASWGRKIIDKMWGHPPGCWN